MVYQLKVRKKGIVILPKDVRVKLSINENDILIANIEGDKLVLRPLKHKIVRVDPKVVEDILEEEGEAERKKEEGIFDGS
ncbi:MAG: AbrB/MazE/SpoVT family DNA-binding domain-containing protein [Acidianus sp.]|jgi:AbrB family looped-hinge helix DNA binding protein|nr:AbrB/MazE/SpoVT family DNA-binding domain-containing protein [Acidianus sp.]